MPPMITVVGGALGGGGKKGGTSGPGKHERRCHDGRKMCVTQCGTAATSMVV